MNTHKYMRIICIKFASLREIRALKSFLLLNTTANAGLLFVFLQSLFAIGEHHASTTKIQ